MNEFSFSIPQNVIVGKGSFSKLSELATRLEGKHAMIISGPSLKKHGLVSRAMDCLEKAGIESDIFVEVEANPSVDTVDKATLAYVESGADFIVALGGGSPMDVAKAVAVTAKYGGSIVDYEGADKVPGKIVPIIAIPTTAGTGSEVTAFSVITDHKRDYKLTVFSYELLPKYAILDAELITTVPASVAAACGIDAFIHAEEAYVSKASSPFSEAMSEKAMELIGKSIRDYVADRTNIEAAENMLVGSLLAGIAFSFARLGNIHAMSHPISALFDVPHGIANAVLFPVIVAYNAVADNGKYLKIYNYISDQKMNEKSFVSGMLVDEVEKLCSDIGIPKGILTAVKSVPKFAEIEDDEIIMSIIPMAMDAIKSGNISVNPVLSDLQDIEGLYFKAL